MTMIGVIFSSVFTVQRHQWLQHRGARQNQYSWRWWRRGNETYRRESRTWLLAQLILSCRLHLSQCCLLCLLLIRLGYRMRMSGVLVFTEITMLSNRISDYPLISQGKTRIPGINDAEECDLTIVSLEPAQGACVLMQISVDWSDFGWLFRVHNERHDTIL